MKAVAIRGFDGPPEITDISVPVPQQDEILIQIEASSVNGFDLVVASGQAQSMMEYRFPVVLGRDFAGTVVSSQHGEFMVGDRVFGMITADYLRDGGFAEYVAVSGSFGVTRIPDDMPIPAAGALALAGTTALDCVSAIAPLPRHTVLVSGATGGVGALATQLITARGATVIATARPGAEEEFVRAMGATDVVDYTGDIALSGVDSVIHLAGDPSALGDLVKRNGSFASTRGVSSIGRSDVTVTTISATPARDTLDQLAEAVTESSLLVPITRTYPLDEALKALEDFAGGSLGKLAISVGV
jgi:NADPH:quinone reductase-like Zn-dependent oxidoreductase